ncbi:MAG: sugar phosphate isomerase/epimerase family protein [Halobacteriaceae archaeon]
MSISQGFTVEGTVEFGEAAAFAADRGFAFLELNMEHAFQRARVDADRVAATLSDHGLDAVVHLPYRLDLGSPHEAVRRGACRETEAAIDAAVAMGADAGVVHATSDADPAAWGQGTLRACVYESVRRLDAYGRERGFGVCVENVKQPFFDAMAFPDLFERTDAAACLDIGHAHASGHDGDAVADLLRSHGERIDHIHLNEARNRGSDEHLPVGMGVVGFAPVAAALRETGWEGTCTHEVYAYDLASRANSLAAFSDLLDGRG